MKKCVKHLAEGPAHYKCSMSVPVIPLNHYFLKVSLCLSSGSIIQVKISDVIPEN